MKHVPHLLVDRPWEDDVVSLSEVQQRHLITVLRVSNGDPVTYTDGKGVLGQGEVLTRSSIVRGTETSVTRPTQLHMAVAPPASKDRQRFLVEKLSELGVEKLAWLRTSHGSDRVPARPKLEGWARAGLEQSRGAWLMDVRTDLLDWDALEHPVAVCESRGGAPQGRPRTVVVGPEGGWAAGEIPDELPRIGLGPTVLRVETAAIVAAVLIGVDRRSEDGNSRT